MFIARKQFRFVELVMLYILQSLWLRIKPQSIEKKFY